MLNPDADATETSTGTASTAAFADTISNTATNPVPDAAGRPERPGPLASHPLDPFALFIGVAFTAIGAILGLDQANSGALVGAALLAAGAIGLMAVVGNQLRRD